MNKVKICENCGEKILDSSKKCPKCGHKNKKSNYTSLVVLIVILLGIVSVFTLSSLGTSDKKEQVIQNDYSVSQERTEEPETEKTVVERELKHGETFEEGCYTVVDNVKITYDGENFVIENNSKNIVRVSCAVYGVKKDGTYQFLGVPTMSGIDEEKYKKDKEENNWAVPEYTNMVRPGGTLTAEIGIAALSKITEMDVDGDGYYDINFTISRQRSETSVTTSTEDKESDYFKLKVK